MLLGVAVAVGLGVLVLFGLLALIDSGRFDDQIAKFASMRLRRPVAFGSLQAHLLSARPSVTFRQLVLGGPAWAGSLNLLEADRLSLAFRWPDLGVTGVDVERPRLHLVRLTKEQSNWDTGKTAGKGGGGGIPASLRTLRVTGGSFTFDDRVADMRLSGAAAYDDKGATFPLKLAAQGLLKGGDVSLKAEGGPLVHQPSGAPYPFSAKIQDGETFLEAKGVSDKPAELTGFDLTVAAHGPNLADMKYLIDLGLPNSAPYRLTTKLSRKGPTTRAINLKALVGQSDFAGSIVSDGSQPRRLITIKLASQTLHAADVATFLGHIPDHAATRSVSGAAKRGGPPGPVLSTSPIDLKRFRLKDARLYITAQRFVIAGVSPGRLSTVGALDHGEFSLKPFRIDFPSGRADGALDMDLNGPNPAFHVAGTVRKAALGSLIPSLAKTLNGTVDIKADVAGSGPSWKAIGLNARGELEFILRDGEMQTSKADVISGAVVQGAFAALANKNATTRLSCALAQVSVGGGQARARKILLVTDAGTAVVEGGVDLKTETIGLTIFGRPSGLKLFSTNAPVSVSGPMLHPKAQVHPPHVLGGPSHPAAAAPKIEGDRNAYCNRLTAGGGSR